MSAPVIAPPKSVDDITAPDDRFRCGPYNAVLFARTCVSRQDMLGKPREQRTGDYSECDGCQVGLAIREKLGAGPPPVPAGKSAHGPGLPYVPKMPGRGPLPMAPEPTKPKPPVPAVKPTPPTPKPSAPPTGEPPVKRKPGRPPKPKPSVPPPPVPTPLAPATPAVTPPAPLLPPVLPSTEEELAAFERDLVGVRNGLLLTASKCEALLSEIRAARARIAAKAEAERQAREAAPR